MITVHRAQTRQSDRAVAGTVWHTFGSKSRWDALADGFGALTVLDEELLPPAADVQKRDPYDGETVVYVHEGGLAFEYPVGSRGVLRAGEFQRTRRDHSEDTNASSTDWARVFWIGLRPPEAGLDVGHEQKRFSTAERRGRLCVVASPDARRESLRIEQDVLMYSALLDPGQHVVHEIKGGRSVWLHLIQGAASIGGTVLLTTADGVAVRGERAVSLTARTETEVLLFDLTKATPTAPETIGAP